MKNAKLIVIQSDTQRIGQKIFNFLEWLHTDKGIGTNQMGGRCADPFYISDDKMMEYWKEFNCK